MDVPWAIEQLRELAQLTTLVERGNGYLTYDAPRGTDEQILANAQITEKILDRVIPTWRDELSHGNADWRVHHAAAIRAIAELDRADEVAHKLGDFAPVLDATALHPWAWEGARSLWESGHYAEAVMAATVKLNAETQNKVARRDISEGALFQQLFSNDPPRPSNPRLRPRGDDGDRTSLSIRRGVVALADAVFGALRNPIAHGSRDFTETEALEALAVVSLLCRWVDEADVHLG
jgi:Protein of unknown function (Hypoth_ymh).